MTSRRFAPTLSPDAPQSDGVSGLILLRADSAYYSAEVTTAARRHQARVSVTACKDRAITAAIPSIGQDAWTVRQHPRALFDDQLDQ